MTVRLIATDLDGTFFGPDHRPTPRNVDAINAARRAGITVAAVTGRSWFNSAELATTGGADLQWFIGSNGGHRYNYVTAELEERITFVRAEAIRIIEIVREELAGAGIGFEADDTLAWDARFLELVPFTLQGSRREPLIEDLDELGEFAKLLVTHHELGPVELAAHARAHVPVQHNITASGVSFVEITPYGADKGAALARLCAELDIAADEVVAFGDNHNDLTMLEWAGRGIAMANALPLVKQSADEVTAANADDGVALVIEELLA